jgi:hypothetical protein
MDLPFSRLTQTHHSDGAGTRMDLPFSHLTQTRHSERSGPVFSCVRFLHAGPRSEESLFDLPVRPSFSQVLN